MAGTRLLQTQLRHLQKQWKHWRDWEEKVSNAHYHHHQHENHDTCKDGIEKKRSDNTHKTSLMLCSHPHGHQPSTIITIITMIIIIMIMMTNRFAIVLPPPNVTGVLHLGHALTATVQDSLVRIIYHLDSMHRLSPLLLFIPATILNIRLYLVVLIK